VKDRYPELFRASIPQIFYMFEWGAVKRMGYRDLILSNTVSNYDSSMLNRFLRRHPVFALTLKPKQSVSAELKRIRRGARLFVYTYTINDPAEQRRFFESGVDGVYTDLPPVPTVR
jgi:glycerophosphoryl diester phosphodiesterase